MLPEGAGAGATRRPSGTVEACNLGRVSSPTSKVLEDSACEIAFLGDLFEGFLMTAHDEKDDSKVVRIWVKQVRDVAYDVEDCLQDFAVRLAKQSWWHIPRRLLTRRRVAKEMKELRAKVEDVSQRNVRYNLIKGPSSKPTTTAGNSSSTSATMSGIEEARRQRDKATADLVQLINKEADDLRVIALWGISFDLGKRSIIRKAYEDMKIRKKFDCHAWIKLIHPFNSTEFLQNIIEQFHINLLLETEERHKASLEGQVLGRMGVKKGDDLTYEFERYVKEKSYLIVLADMSTIEEWNHIKTYFPNNKKGSRIIVSTRLVGVASLCVEQENTAPENKQLSVDGQTLHAFYEKGSQHGTDPTEYGSISNAATTCSNSYADMKYLTGTETTVAAFKESRLIGRGHEKDDIIELISNGNSQQLKVISVWGMGGLGKTTLVRDIYQSQKISGMFEKRACVTVMHPFNPNELLESLAMQFGAKDVTDLATHLEGKRYLIVLDDLSFIEEWYAVLPHLPTMAASCIVVTTRKESIAKHCSKEERNIHRLSSLEHNDARVLFVEKVFDKITDLDEQYPELVEQANLILRKCNGLPLAIVTIGGFLANQPKTVLEWRKLNEHISAELEMNPQLGTIRTVLSKSYDGLPYHLKSCFLYLPIFPEAYKVSRRRLVRRWTAEGYSREVRGRSAEEIADTYFMELIGRSMVLPSQLSIDSREGINSCQVHDLIREIAISKSMEENLVYRMEEGCSRNTQGIVRHLAVSSNWKGDESELDSKLDMSRLRSMTVFGKWRPFFTFDKMRLLRVLDLEGTSGLVDHHLAHIGKLLHLRYLSLRGCNDIYHLPDSLGNLRQLESLDVTDTKIIKLPRTIIKLRKLQHILAGYARDHDDELYESLSEGVPKLLRNNLGSLTAFSAGFCVACCTPHLMKEKMDMDGDVNRRDVCTMCCCAMLPALLAHHSPGGVSLPKGIHKLKALLTLGIVDLSGRRKASLQDIKRLTQLLKLKVNGFNERNGQELRSAIANLSYLESLLVKSEGMPGLSGCLDSLSSPPQNLRSLKLYGNLVKLPQWVNGLKNLVELKLRSSRISDHEGAIQLLGKIPHLTFLCLWKDSFEGSEVHLSFCPDSFPSLVVLQLDCLDNLKSVKFEVGAALKLEMLQFNSWSSSPTVRLFAGLSTLPSLKEFMLDSHNYAHEFVEDLRGQLAENQNGAVLKRFQA